MAKDFETILRSSDIRPTAMRLLVLRYLDAQIYAVSLNAIEEGLNHPDKVTLYRTMKTFQEKGLVHIIEDGTSTTKFALSIDDEETGSNLHIHFYCKNCKKTYRLPKTHAPDLTLPAEFQLENMNLVAKGICNKCSKKIFNDKNTTQTS